MRKFLFLIITCFIIGCTNYKSNLSATVKNAADGEIISLIYPILENGIWYDRVDSLVVTNGGFQIMLNITEPTPAYLVFDDMSDTKIYLEPKNMKLQIDKNKPYDYKLSGTISEKECAKLREEYKSFQKIRYQKHRLIQKLISESTSPDAQNIDSIMMVAYDELSTFQNNNQIIDSILLKYAIAHIDYSITPDILYMLSQRSSDKDNLNAIFDKLPVKNQKSLMGQIAALQLSFSENDESFNEGDMAPDFIRRGARGNIIRLSDYRNRSYVLLDFWGSWCKPCIKELPKVKALSEKYDKNNLEIIGVASEDDKYKWLQAIEEYDLKTYPHVLSVELSDENYKPLFRTDISGIYDVQYVPFYVLIDKSGRIVARWQHIGDEQLKFIDNILNTSL